jgi:hypothetical protein
MAAAAIPSAECTPRRLPVERAVLTVVIDFLHMQFLASLCISRVLDGGIVVVGASHQTA